MTVSTSLPPAGKLSMTFRAKQKPTSFEAGFFILFFTNRLVTVHFCFERTFFADTKVFSLGGS
jgi:hypothetical protein